MSRKFWNIRLDPRFNPSIHLEPSVGRYGLLGPDAKLSEAGKALDRTIFLENAEKPVTMVDLNGLDKHILAIAPDDTRHAMVRSEPKPSLFDLPISALCGVSERASLWVLGAQTTNNVLCRQGVLTCEYCQGILVVQSLGE